MEWYEILAKFGDAGASEAVNEQEIETHVPGPILNATRCVDLDRQQTNGQRLTLRLAAGV